MEGLRIVILNLFLFLLHSTEILGSWDHASTSAYQEIVENGPEQVTMQNINSFVSFQNRGLHICGGARLNIDQVLILEISFNEINKNYNQIYAVILTDLRISYSIEKYKKVSNDFTIIVLRIPEDEKTDNVAVTFLSANQPDTEQGVTLVGWSQTTENREMRHSTKVMNAQSNSIILDDWVIGDFPFETKFIGNLQFQYTSLVAIAKERTVELCGTKQCMGTVFVNIHNDYVKIQNALKNHRLANNFEKKGSSFKISGLLRCMKTSSSHP